MSNVCDQCGTLVHGERHACFSAREGVVNPGEQRLADLLTGKTHLTAEDEQAMMGIGPKTTFEKGQRVHSLGMGYGNVLVDEGEVCIVQFESFPMGQTHTVTTAQLTPIVRDVLDGFNSNPPGGTICLKCFTRTYGNRHACYTDSKVNDLVKAPRQSVDYDYRELDWDFVNAMARMGQHGAQKYGNGTWRHKKMTGDADPINHAIEHIKAYIQLEGHDNFEDNRMNLAAAAFNLMLAYYHTREIKS